MEIQFLNHASVKIITEDVAILTDPWFKGSTFNNGWDLLTQPPGLEELALEGVTHIYVSHEHPDHFSVPYFLSFPEARKQDIEVLFQRTKDKRVCHFLRSKGFVVRELGHHEPFALGATELRIGKSAFYDSYLHIRSGSESLLNLNDCPVTDAAPLKKLRNRFGAPTVLLSQFSYAAWKGGREHKPVRERLARTKLHALKNQVRYLNAEYLIPFASFIYFSNEENSYMNDSVNTIDTVFESLKDSQAQLITLEPGERWAVREAHDNTNPARFWRETFAGVSRLPHRKAGESVDEATLHAAFRDYKQRVLAKNNAFLINLIRRLPGLGAFRPINILLSDFNDGQGERFRLDFNTGLSRHPDGSYDVKMHSSSLLFIFKNEFGYDTLTVNARFEASPEGFSKMTKFLAIGSLNAMGLSLSFSFFRHWDIAYKLLRLMRRVRKTIAT